MVLVSFRAVDLHSMPDWRWTVECMFHFHCNMIVLANWRRHGRCCRIKQIAMNPLMSRFIRRAHKSMQFALGTSKISYNQCNHIREYWSSCVTNLRLKNKSKNVCILFCSSVEFRLNFIFQSSRKLITRQHTCIWTEDVKPDSQNRRFSLQSRCH